MLNRVEYSFFSKLKFFVSVSNGSVLTASVRHFFVLLKVKGISLFTNIFFDVTIFYKVFNKIL